MAAERVIFYRETAPGVFKATGRILLRHDDGTIIEPAVNLPPNAAGWKDFHTTEEYWTRYTNQGLVNLAAVKNYVVGS